MSCLGMPTTGNQTFQLSSINGFLTLKQCSADSDHHKGSGVVGWCEGAG